LRPAACCIPLRSACPHEPMTFGLLVCTKEPGMTVEDNWIETSAIGPRLVSWRVVRAGKVIHSDEWVGNDPTGLRAYRVGLDWVEVNYPSTPFHWRHQALAWTIRGAAEAVVAPRRNRVR